MIVLAAHPVSAEVPLSCPVRPFAGLADLRLSHALLIGTLTVEDMSADLIVYGRNDPGVRAPLYDFTDTPAKDLTACRTARLRFDGTADVVGQAVQSVTLNVAQTVACPVPQACVQFAVPSPTCRRARSDEPSRTTPRALA